MATALHNLSDYDFSKVPDASNMCFGIVVAEWNSEITGALLDGAVKTLKKHGALPENIHVKTVPGSFRTHIWSAPNGTKWRLRCTDYPRLRGTWRHATFRFYMPRGNVWHR